MSKNVTQKIREILTSEDLKLFEGAVESMIESRVTAKLSDLIHLKEDELKNKFSTLADEYVAKTLKAKMVKEKAKLVESYDKKLTLLEQRVATKLDSYLDHMISTQISDAMLDKIAVNETLMPVVEGIRAVFGDNHLKLDSKAKSKLDGLEKEIETLKSELSESIDSRLKIEGKLEQSAVYLLISEKTNGFKNSDKQKVVEMFKDKDFDEVEKNIENYISLIKESESHKSKKSAVNKTTAPSKKVSGINEGAMIDSKKPIKKDLNESALPSLNEIANKYLF